MARTRICGLSALNGLEASWLVIGRSVHSGAGIPAPGFWTGRATKAAAELAAKPNARLVVRETGVMVTPV